MNKENWLSGRERELQEMAAEYEAAKAEMKPLYLDEDDAADLADWYASQQKMPQAFDVVEYGLSLHPESVALLVEKSYLYIDSRQREKARVVADSITDDSLAEVKILKANLLLGEGREEEADMLIDSVPDKNKLFNIVDIAGMYLEMNRPDKALQWVEKGLSINADHEACLALKGDSYYAKGMMNEAILAYNRLLDQNPYSAPYWHTLAQCYFALRMFDKVIEACDFAIVADENFAEAYIMKGHAFFQLGNEDAALECYKMAAKHNAITPTFLNMFVGLYKTSNEEWEEGYKHLECAINSQDVDPTLLASLYAHAAFCLHYMGKERKSKQYFKKSHEMDATDVDSHLLEGRILMEKLDYDKAVECWKVALKHAPYAETWHEIGVSCMEVGELDDAIAAFQQVLAMEPNFAGIYEKLSSVYIMTRDTQSFLKYNKLCDYPIEGEELKRTLELMEDKDGVGIISTEVHLVNRLL